MVRRIQLPKSVPVLSEASSEEDALIRTVDLHEKERKARLLTPVRLSPSEGGSPDSPPEIFRLSAYDVDDEFPLIERSGPPDSLLVPMLGSSEDGSSAPSPRGVDCPQNRLYPLYDRFGYRLEPKPFVISHPIDEQIALIDLLSELSDEDKDEDAPSPRHSPQPRLDGAARTRVFVQDEGYVGGVEECKDEDDDSYSIYIVPRRQPASIRSSFSSSGLDSKPSAAEKPLEWFLDCFGCGGALPKSTTV